MSVPPRPAAFRADSVRRAAALGIALLFALACGPRRLDGVPSDLLGTWRTRAPRYEKNFFEVRRDVLVLGVAGQELDVLPIQEIDWTTDGHGNVIYRFRFLADEGYPDVLLVTRVGSGARAIRLASQADLWTPGSR
jgi:hypothetical protein